MSYVFTLNDKLIAWLSTHTEITTGAEYGVVAFLVNRKKVHSVGLSKRCFVKELGRWWSCALSAPGVRSYTVHIDLFAERWYTHHSGHRATASLLYRHLLP